MSIVLYSDAEVHVGPGRVVAEYHHHRLIAAWGDVMESLVDRRRCIQSMHEASSVVVVRGASLETVASVAEIR